MLLASDALATHYHLKMRMIVSADSTHCEIEGVITQVFFSNVVQKAVAHASTSWYYQPFDQNGVLTYAFSRLQRWVTIPIGCNFDIKYCETTDHGQADGFSRVINNQQLKDENIVMAAVSAEQAIGTKFSEAISATSVTSADVRRSTLHDPTLWWAIMLVQTSWPHDHLTCKLLNFHRRRYSLPIVQSCPTTSNLMTLPGALRLRILR